MNRTARLRPANRVLDLNPTSSQTSSLSAFLITSPFPPTSGSSTRNETNGRAGDSSITERDRFIQWTFETTVTDLISLRTTVTDSPGPCSPNHQPLLTSKILASSTLPRWHLGGVQCRAFCKQLSLYTVAAAAAACIGISDTSTGNKAL